MGSTHDRNTGPMLAAARCGAQTRKGTACAAPAVRGKARCRMHGGSQGSGAPMGNQNALKSGNYTADALSMRKHVNQLVRESKKLFEDI